MLLKPQAPEDPEGTPSAINKRLAIRCHDLMNQVNMLDFEVKRLKMMLEVERGKKAGKQILGEGQQA